MGNNPDNIEKPIQEADVVYFMYRNHDEKFEQRLVKIEKLWYGKSVHYENCPTTFFLRGECQHRRSGRDFMLSRIVGMHQWQWLLDGSHPIERPLGTSAEQALLALYTEITSGDTIPNLSVDDAFNVIMGEHRSKKAREDTMLLDANGQMIHVGDMVRLAVDNPFGEVHGEWCDYTVEKCPAGYRLSYFVSELGQKLPVGYTAGFMSDYIMEQVGIDMKTVVFSQVPLRSKRLTIVNEKYL